MNIRVRTSYFKLVNGGMAKDFRDKVCNGFHLDWTSKMGDDGKFVYALYGATDDHYFQPGELSPYIHKGWCAKVVTYAEGDNLFEAHLVKSAADGGGVTTFNPLAQVHQAMLEDSDIKEWTSVRHG